MTKVPARPANVVPARPPVAAAPKPGTAAIPAAAKAPVAAASVPPAVVNETSQPSEETPPVDSGAVETTSETPAAPKKRGRKKGSGAAGGGAPKKTPYKGLFSFDESGAPVMVDDGAGGTYHQRVLLDSIPADFDFARNEKLKESDFTSPALFFDFMAKRFSDLSKSFEKKAKRARTLGSATDQKKALKFIKMREEMQKLAEQLKADGMDVDSLDDDETAAPVDETAAA